MVDFGVSFNSNLKFMDRISEKKLIKLIVYLVLSKEISSTFANSA